MDLKTMDYLAQASYPLQGTINGFGELGNPGSDAPGLFVDVISSTIGLLTIIAGIYFFFVLVSGAIQWIASSGDKGAIERARSRISHGIIGLAIVVAAIFIVEIVGQLLGFSSILDPAAVIHTLQPGGGGGAIAHHVDVSPPDLNSSCNNWCASQPGVMICTPGCAFGPHPNHGGICGNTASGFYGYFDCADNINTECAVIGGLNWTACCCQ